MTDPDDRVAELRDLGNKLDRITVLLVALLVVQSFHVAGDLVANLLLVGLGVGLVGLVAVLLVGLGRGL